MPVLVMAAVNGHTAAGACGARAHATRLLQAEWQVVWQQADHARGVCGFGTVEINNTTPVSYLSYGD
jgi:aerobic-type carbon monoxide dehydrogenase small subunit (CoxS/CutS family)